MTGIGVFVGGWIQGGTGPFHSWPIYAAGLAAFCVAAFGNLLNDLGDIEVDRRAHPDRPLPRQEISVSVARLMAVGCAIVGIGLAALVSVPVALFAAAAFLLLVLYEIRLKALGLPGNAAVSLLTGAPFVFGGLVLGTPGSGLLLLAGLAALSNLGREVLKDIEDMGGDVGRATFPRTRGVPAARAVAASSFGAAVLLSPLPWVDSIVGSGYVPFVLLADAGFVAAALDPKAGRGQRVAKAAMVVALVAFIAGRSFGGAVHGA
jgi:geranylgeranylglycerol-phosphate geranylgeranyltransferase